MLFEVSPPVAATFAKHSGCERTSERERNSPNGEASPSKTNGKFSIRISIFIFAFRLFRSLIFRTLNCDTSTRNCWDALKWKITLTQLALQQEPTEHQLLATATAHTPSPMRRPIFTHGMASATTTATTNIIGELFTKIEWWMWTWTNVLKIEELCVLGECSFCFRTEMRLLWHCALYTL